MKPMKRALFTVMAVLLLATLVVWAGGDEKMKKLKVDLNLTDAQVTALERGFDEMKPLGERYKAAKAELDALENSNPASPSAIAAKKTELASVKKQWKEQYEALFRSVLTDAQWTRYQAMQREAEKKQRPARNS